MFEKKIKTNTYTTEHCFIRWHIVISRKLGVLSACPTFQLVITTSDFTKGKFPLGNSYIRLSEPKEMQHMNKFWLWLPWNHRCCWLLWFTTWQASESPIWLLSSVYCFLLLFATPRSVALDTYSLCAIGLFHTGMKRWRWVFVMFSLTFSAAMRCRVLLRCVIRFFIFTGCQ